MSQDPISEFIKHVRLFRKNYKVTKADLGLSQQTLLKPLKPLR